MTQENDAKRLIRPDEVLSQPESDLQELNSRIRNLNEYLMETFFQEDTWSVRQGVGYGFPILEGNHDGKDHDWEKEEQVLKSIFDDLGERMDYYEAAYHFPDVLSAFAAGTNSSWIDMITKDGKESKAQAAARIHAETEEELRRETREFEKFLKSDIFKQAFSIKIDKKTGEYTISDLHLDPNELRAQWDNLVTSDFSRA